MFKNLLKFWKGKDFLNQVLEDFKSMLNDTEQMFNLVTKKLIDNEDSEGLKEKVYSIDRTVNALEKDIRKRIVEHLTLQPSVDVSVSLLLMSVVKDAERLGDYCKNLYEVTTLVDSPLDNKQYLELLNGVDKSIVLLFDKTKKAFIDSDEEKAKSCWEIERGVTKHCDDLIKKLAASNLDANKAVTFTLIARYYKRLASHLTNIATSVILPISEIDYFDKRNKS